MIRIARPLYADEDLGLELDHTVYALNADRYCLNVIDRFRSADPSTTAA